MVLLEDCQGLLVMTHADRDRCVYIWAHNNSTFNFKQYYYMQQWLGSWKFRTIKFFLVKILTSQSFCVYKWKKFILIFDVLSTGYNGLLRESHYFFVRRFTFIIFCSCMCSLWYWGKDKKKDVTHTLWFCFFNNSPKMQRGCLSGIKALD